VLWVKAGGMCSFKNCREELLIDNIKIGHIAHIVAKSPRGPRGESAYEKDSIDHYDNLILLCPTHHQMVDSKAEDWPSETLQDMKIKHEGWVREKLLRGNSWSPPISQLCYINIPRLSILAGLYNKQVPSPLEIAAYNLHSLGIELLYLMQFFKQLLEDIQPHALSFEDITTFDNSYIGATFGFNTNFRTKNGVYVEDVQDNRFTLKGDLRHDPYIYHKFKHFKLILPINPRWITTTTAICQFSSGQVRFAGLCVVKAMNGNGDVVASPLVLGTPKSIWDDFLKSS